MKQGEKQTIKTDRAYFLTLTVVGWVDVFSRQNHRNAFINSLKYCQQNKGLIVFAYVIMTNHIHLMVNTHEPFLLKDVIRDLKKYTSKQIIEQIIHQPESRKEWMLQLLELETKDKQGNKNHKFWQEGNHAIELYNEKFVWDKINYIHNNPVEAGFVRKPYEWIYSSASNYYSMESIIEVECLQQRLNTI
ncbi:MAG: transposase [Bacteroidetes bacterium]|nr:transposase [Bacteroidota bacterium]